MAPRQRYEVALDTRLDIAPPGRPERIGDPVDIWFEGRRFRWFPGTAEHYARLAVDIADQGNPENAYHLEGEALERLLSALTYHLGIPIRSMSAGVVLREESDPPPPVPRYLSVRVRLNPEVIVETDPETRACLALMREAMTSVNIALTFLAYWKVIELIVGKRGMQKWINDQRDRMRTAHGAEYRLDLGDNWHSHLNESRIAAAHAVPTKPGALRIDPDDPQLEYRLQSDIGIISMLAKYAIEERWPKPVRETYPPDAMLGRGAEWERLMKGPR